MKKEFKILGLFYFLFVILKMAIGSLIPLTLGYADNYVYSKIASSLATHGHALIYNIFPVTYPLLYPLYLAPAHFFADINIVFFLVKLLNSLAAASTIIPIYLLARKFLNKQKSFLIVILTMLTYPLLLYSNLIMAENLLFPLMAWFVYFLYDAISRNKLSSYFISGVFMGLAFITKNSALALLGVLVLTIILSFLFKQSKFNLKGIILHYVSFVPFFLFNLFYHLSFGDNSALTKYSGIVARTSNLLIFEKALLIFDWFIIYIGMIILASGIITFIYFLAGSKLKDKKYVLLFSITLSLIVVFALELAIKSSGNIFLTGTPFTYLTVVKPIARYIDPILPILILTGIVAYFKNKINSLWLIGIITSFILAITSQLNVYTLFPSNNGSIAYVGFLDFVIEYLFLGKINYSVEFYWISFVTVLLFLVVIPFVFIILRKKTFHLLLIFFLINTCLAGAMLSWDANNWYNNNQTELGLELNDISDKGDVFFFDVDSCANNNLLTKENLNDVFCRYRVEKRHASSWLAYWLNRDMIFDSFENLENYSPNYIVTLKDLDYELVAEKGIFKAYRYE